MFSVNDDMSIYVTRGDVVFFTVTADDNGKGYTFNPGDVVRLKITEKKASESVVLQKDFPVTEATEAVQILLTGDETKFGEVISKPIDYWYEIELNPHTNPQTILGYDEDGAKIFKLFPEGNDMEPTPIEPEDIPVVDEELSLTSDRPVQNQAVARAVLGLDDKISATNTRFNLLCTLKEGSTTGDAELADIRIGVDGTVYGSAGEAVRDQVSDLKNILLQHEADFYGPIQEAKEAATSAKASEENTVENAQKAQEAAESILGVEENVRSLEQNIEEFAERAEDAAGVAQAVAQFEIDTKVDANSYNPIANKAVAEKFANYLPLSGGAVKNQSIVPFVIDTSAEDERVLLYFKNKGIDQGYLGFNKVNTPIFMTDGGLRYPLLHTGNMASHVLPLSGGTATNFTVGTNGSIGVPAVKLLNSDGTVAGYFGMSYGALRKWDTAFKPYEVLDTGNMANHVLPLDGGGEVSKAGVTPLILNNKTANSDAWLGFRSGGVNKGFLGFNKTGTPQVSSDGVTFKDILHTGNMASHVLPLSGGTATNFGVDVHVTIGQAGLAFKKSGVINQYLTYDHNTNDLKRWATDFTTKTILDTGNSAKVHIGTSAPSDTSALWIDTSA